MVIRHSSFVIYYLFGSRGPDLGFWTDGAYFCRLAAATSDNTGMSVIFSCCNVFAALSKAAAKSAAARFRIFGFTAEHPAWAARATVCERCPLRVVERNVSYCGKPFLKKIDRDEAMEGCGCPIRAKAKDPSEHCPVTPRHLPAEQSAIGCTCKWCQGEVLRTKD
jgi:hypothetical protein